MCRKLQTKIERENHDLKEELILCLMDLVKDAEKKSKIKNEQEYQRVR